MQKQIAYSVHFAGKNVRLPFFVVLLGISGAAMGQGVENLTLFCPIVSDAPIVDGLVGDDEWRNSSTISKLQQPRRFSGTKSADTLVKLLADSSHLYVAFVCEGRDGKPSDPVRRGRDEAKATDNLVTVYLDLEHDHKSSSSFTVDYFGQQSDAINLGIGSKGGSDIEWNAKWQSAAVGGISSWSVELAIPIAELTGARIEPGRTMGINFLRRRPDLAQYCYYVTSAIAESRFYWAHAFADLVFGRPGVVVSKIDLPEWRQGRNTIGMELKNYGDTTEEVDVAARTSSNGGVSQWETRHVTVRPHGVVKADSTVHLTGDLESQFDLRLSRREPNQSLYSAIYKQLNFGPSYLRFAATEAMDELGHKWNINTAKNVCLQPDAFNVELVPATSRKLAAKLRVRMETRSRRSGQLVKEDEFSFSSGSTVRGEAATSGLPDDQYIFQITVTGPRDKTLLRTAHQFVCVGGEFSDVRPSLFRLQKKIAAHKERAESINYSRSSFMLLEYLVDRAERLIEGCTVRTYRKNLTTARELLTEAATRTDDFDNGKDPLAGRTGILQRAYLSPYSRELRHYTIFIPKSYDASKPMPMVTQFLTDGPNPDWKTGYDPWKDYRDQTLGMLEQKGFIMMWPGPTRRMESEVNFFAILEEMKKDYNIDLDRLYLMGISGGGLTSWLIGMRYPEQIAAICPISSVTIRDVPANWPFLNSSGLMKKRPIGSSEWPQIGRKVILDARSSYYFPMNALHLPVLILHGDADTSTLVDVQARPMVKKMRELGLEVEYVEYPGVGHGLDKYYMEGFSEAMDFFSKHQNVRHPNTIDYTTPSIRYNKAYWIRIGALRQDGEFARIQAEAEGNTVTVRTENIGAFSVLRDQVVFDVTKPLAIAIDGQRVHHGPAPATGGIGFVRSVDGKWK